MKLKEMVVWFAANTGIAEASLTETARALQKAGWIKTGRQGRHGGAEMDERDAAALVIAVLAAEGRRAVVDAGEIVATISAFKVWQVYEPHDPEAKPISPLENLLGLPADHQLIDLVCRLIACEPLSPRKETNVVLGFDLSARFPSLTVTVTFGFVQPRRLVAVDYWDPRAERWPELAVEGSQALRECFWESDAFTKERKFRDRFFSALHRELFTMSEGDA